MADEATGTTSGGDSGTMGVRWRSLPRSNRSRPASSLCPGGELRGSTRMMPACDTVRRPDEPGSPRAFVHAPDISSRS